MNSAFLRLRDYAVDCGLLECMPQVGRQLRETTETFLSLARKSSDDAFNDDDHSRPHESDSLPARRYAPRRKPSSRGQEQGTEDVSQRQLYGGFIITQEQVPVTSPDMPSGTTSVTEPTTAPDYGAITYPNLDNASFSFGTAPDFSFTAPELTTSTAQADFPDITNLNSPLYRSLPLPTSFAAQEVTFGRRVQRRCLERAWGLVNMPNPPPKRFSRVFGFCLLFEPLEAIKARVRRCLDRTASETLNNSQYPFLQLGGSTTHFEPIPGQRFGNQGAADAMRSKVANGYGMGPFDAKTSAARDLLGANQYLPHGSAGPEFYDCDEIEMYLHQRGVAIPSGADFVTAEIEVAAFADGPSRNQQAMSDNRSTASANAGSANSLDAFTPQTSSASGSASSDARSAMSAGPLSPAASSGGEAALAASSGTDFSLTDMWQMDRHWKGFVPGKRHVTVDINRLVAGMCYLASSDQDFETGETDADCCRNGESGYVSWTEPGLEEGGYQRRLLECDECNGRGR